MRIGSSVVILIGFLAAGLMVGSSPAAPGRDTPKAGEERAFEIGRADGTPVKMVFCRVPAGKSTLGSPTGQDDRRANEPEHDFTTPGFWLGKHEVTQAEWAAVTGTHPSAFDGTKEGEAKAKGLDTSRFPVEHVSWDDCRAFAAKATEHARDQAVRFRLPAEDEWEYACRAGKGNRQWFYPGDGLDATWANFGERVGRPTAVGSFEKQARHPWGLCDTHGNVWEWCESAFAAGDRRRVNRGGSWGNDAKDCRAAYRNGNPPETRSPYLGVRLALE